MGIAPNCATNKILHHASYPGSRPYSAGLGPCQTGPWRGCSGRGSRALRALSGNASGPIIVSLPMLNEVSSTVPGKGHGKAERKQSGTGFGAQTVKLSRKSLTVFSAPKIQAMTFAPPKSDRSPLNVSFRTPHIRSVNIIGEIRQAPLAPACD